MRIPDLKNGITAHVGAFVKEKVQDSRVSEEGVERLSNSFLHSPKKSARRATCEFRC
jgi:hypothetical protein